MKSQVFELGSHLNLPKEILSATPTDGLWEDGRNDEAQIGASYDEIEWAMNRDSYDINSETNNREKEVIGIFKSLNTKNMHKMIPIPVCEIPKDFL